VNIPHPFDRPPGSSMTSALTTVPHDLNRSFKSCHFTSQLRLPTYIRHPKAFGCVLKSTGGLMGVTVSFDGEILCSH
jgi:hypothetical protein